MLGGPVEPGLEARESPGRADGGFVAIRLSGGVRYEFRENISLDFAYLYLDAGDAKIEQAAAPGSLKGSLFGEYERNDIHMLNAILSWRF